MITNRHSTNIKLNYHINKPLDIVFDCLSNMEKFVTVHPVITRVDQVEGDNYLLYETLRIWIFSFSFTYPVNIKINAEKKLVVMDALVMRLVNIKMNIPLRELNGITLVEEEIHFNTWLPVKWIMKSIFKKQHARLFKNIEKLQSPHIKILKRMPNTD